MITTRSDKLRYITVFSNGVHEATADTQEDIEVKTKVELDRSDSQKTAAIRRLSIDSKARGHV